MKKVLSKVLVVLLFGGMTGVLQAGNLESILKFNTDNQNLVLEKVKESVGQGADVNQATGFRKWKRESPVFKIRDESDHMF